MDIRKPISSVVGRIRNQWNNIMGFGVDLQGKESHEALLRIQDGEIRLLESMRKCLHVRVDSDRRYVAALMQFVQHAQKLEPAEFSATCTVFKAWDVIVRETKQFIQHLTTNTDELSMRALEKLNSLISEKKAAKKFYMDERNRLEIDFAKLTDDVQKMQCEYSKVMERLGVDKQKYEEIYQKAKPGGKLEDARNRYARTTMRLHRLHNNYVLGLKEVLIHQSNYLQHTLPCLLDYHQVTQQILVQQCKDLLLDYSRLSNLGSTRFMQVYQTIQTAVEEISSETEYSGFIDQNMTDPPTPMPFDFDDRLLHDYTGSLRCNEITVDDLSYDALQQRKSELEEAVLLQRKSLGDKTKDLNNLQHEIDKLKQQVTENSDEVTKNDFYVKRRAIEIIKREVRELECGMSKNMNLLEFINEPMMTVNVDCLPVALALPDTSIGDIHDIFPSNATSSSSHSALSGIKSRLKSIGGNFRKNPTSMSTSSLSAKEDNNCNNTDLCPEEALDHHRPSQTLSYEPTIRNGVGGFIVDTCDENTAQLSEMDWFHGILPRDEVQRLLQKEGDFLVRESKNKKTNDTTYVLSVFWQVPKHFIILNVEGGWRFEGQIFPTIPDLIEYQFHSREPVTSKSQAILVSAVVRSDWELQNDDIQLLQKIGNGNFGEVFKGMYTPRNLVVAVKTCRDTLSEDQKRKFLGEGRILKQYHHPNIVKFIGIATQRQPVMIIMEFCTGGALLNFLRKQGKLQPKRTLIQMCHDASSGMEYLEMRGCIHRDLATRNCLISDNNSVKISDFGMSREEEEYTVSEGLKQIPIKWTAPEALNFGRYTSLCDVWSFGVLMWEVFSFGQTPYTGMSNAQARERIEEGMRLESPDGCLGEIYELMRQCWEYEPENRPHFNEVVRELGYIINNL